jgi:AcrR family transcriptional regulator
MTEIGTRAGLAARHRSAQPEEAILEAARDLIAGGGVDALSMRAVADRVGVTATAIYHYFDGKQDLVTKVVRRGFERFGEYLERGMAQYPSGSLERIRGLGEAYLRFALENQAYFRVIFGTQAHDARAIDDLPEGGGYHLLRRSIVEAMESGALRRGDPDVIALYLWSTIHGLVMLTLMCDCDTPLWHGKGVPLSAEQLYEAFGPLVADGVRGRRE